MKHVTGFATADLPSKTARNGGPRSRYDDDGRGGSVVCLDGKNGRVWLRASAGCGAVIGKARREHATRGRSGDFCGARSSRELRLGGGSGQTRAADQCSRGAGSRCGCRTAGFPGRAAGRRSNWAVVKAEANGRDGNQFGREPEPVPPSTPAYTATEREP